jgi:cysteinyl-tRNA synthetase
MLKTHYTSPIDWTMKSLEESARTLDDWYRIAADIEPAKPAASVVEALLDDLNTPQAIAALHGVRGSDVPALAGSLRLLGFLSESAAQWEGRKQQASGIDARQVESLIAERTAARARKDFRESDRIRDQLAAMGVAIKDSKEGTTWEVAR